ncbi:MAG: ABC transporter permease [Spirochaetales bacterium]
MTKLLFLAWRNFSRHLSRYRVLLTALILVVAALIVVLGAVYGMRETLREKASRYFAGDIVVFGYMDGSTSRIEDPALVDDLIDNASLNERARSRRSTYYSETEANLFHGGYYTQQRRFLGVEWDLERPMLERFDFVSGGVPEAGDREGILISTAAAESLQASVGDSVLVSTSTDRGQANTIEATVRGVYREATFFGYTSYLQRETLNRLLGRPEEQVNEIGVYLDGAGESELAAARRVNRELARELPTFPVIRDREANSDERAAERDERHYGTITLGAQLAEINDLLEALTIIAAVIIVMFLLLVIIGVSNTFSMIIYERTREIGTLRAMGMQRARTVSLFLLESLYLGLSGAAFGSVIGVGLLELAATLLDFSGAPGFASLFLVAGQLRWSIPPEAFLALALLSVGASVVGCFRAALRAGRTSPVDALRHE